MKLAKVSDNRYEFACTYRESLLPKTAGFWWDPSTKLWWTPKREVARVLSRYADPPLAEELERAGTPLISTLPPRPKRLYPVPTEGERIAATEGIRMLARLCDGGRADDDRGFTPYDAKAGHDLARRQWLTDGQVWFAGKLLWKYRRQLPAEIFEVFNPERSRA